MKKLVTLVILVLLSNASFAEETTPAWVTLLNDLEEKIQNLSRDSYVSDVIGISYGQECINNENGLKCENVGVILINLAPGGEVTIQGNSADAPEKTITITAHKPLQTNASIKDFDIDVTLTGDTTQTFKLSPDRPIYSSLNDASYPGGEVKVTCKLITDSQIRVAARLTDIKVINSESDGIINVNATTVEPYGPGARKIKIKTSIFNQGKARSNYIVSIINLPERMVAPLPQSVTLDPEDLHQLEFVIEIPGGEPEGQASFEVLLQSPTGRQYDSWIVTSSTDSSIIVPGPLHAADLTGDGKVDLQDLATLAASWLAGY